MYHDATIGRAPDRSTDLPTRVADACRRLGEHATDLTPRERQLLRDLQRVTSGEARYAWRTLETLLTIAARVPVQSGQGYALLEALRGYQIGLVQCPGLSWFDAFQLEGFAQLEGDLAQFRYAFDRSPATRDAAIEKLALHGEAIRVAVDTLHRERTPRVLTLSGQTLGRERRQ